MDKLLPISGNVPPIRGSKGEVIYAMGIEGSANKVNPRCKLS